MAQNLKINDKVKIISGNNKGKEAKIVKIDRKAGKAMLDGIGVVERHLGRGMNLRTLTKYWMEKSKGSLKAI